VTKKLSSGDRFRKRVDAQLALDDADELWVALLDQAADVLDAIEVLERSVNGNVISPGSRDQDRIHPAFAEIRQQRLVLAKILKDLGLNEQPDSEATRTARAAAQARWHGARHA
jgi:hypothetical protein